MSRLENTVGRGENEQRIARELEQDERRSDSNEIVSRESRRNNERQENRPGTLELEKVLNDLRNADDGQTANARQNELDNGIVKHGRKPPWN